MWRWTVVLVALSVVSAFNAAADEIVHQQDFFAIYCIGVLDATAKRRAELPSHQCFPIETKQACDDRSRRFQQLNWDHAYRRGRFEGYLKGRTATSAARAAALKAASPNLLQMGSADLEACLHYGAASLRRFGSACEKACEGGAMSIDCLECFRREDIAVCKSVSRCEDPALLPF